MKKILLVVLCTGMLVSCTKGNSNDVPATMATNRTIEGSKYNVYEVEGCEYIGMYVGTTRGILTHKGNCKYCTERSKTK